jgi:hypothetical protein
MPSKKQIRVVIDEQDLKLFEAVLFSRSQSGDKKLRTPEQYLKEVIDDTISPCKPDYEPSRGKKADKSAEETLREQRETVVFNIVQLLNRGKIPTIINIKSKANMSLQTVVATMCREGLYELFPRDDSDDGEYSLQAIKNHPLLAPELEVETEKYDVVS